MEVHSWNSAKNRLLKAERGVSFEEVVFCIERGPLLAIIIHKDVSGWLVERREGAQG